MSTTTTGSDDFDKILTSVCLRKGVLACSIEEMKEGAAPVSLPIRSDVILLENLARKMDASSPDSCPAAGSSSSLSYLLTPIKKTASILGATASFVLQSPDIIAKALLPASEYEEADPQNGVFGNTSTGERIEESDVLVSQSLFGYALKSIKLALDSIPPSILTAAELKTALTPKLQDIVSEPHLTWVQSLPPDHWDILVSQSGLGIVSKDASSADGTATQYIIGETEQPIEARLTLKRIDANLSKLEEEIAKYESKMQIESKNATQSKKKNTKLHAMRIYKIYEKHLNEAHASRLNLLSIRESVEGAVKQRDTISALKAASDTLNNLRIDEDIVFDIVDELQTNVDEFTLDAKMINQNNPVFDEQALMDELNTLAEDDTDAEKPSSDDQRPPLKSLPDISEAELKELDELNDENLGAPSTLTT